MKDFKKGSRPVDGMRVAVTALVLVGLLAGCETSPPQHTPPPSAATLRFEGANAYDLTAAQVLYANGSTRFRVPNSTGNDEVARWASDAFNASGWIVSWQGFSARYGCVDTPMHNVVAQRNGTSGKLVILGAHYDTRPVGESDGDPQNQALRIPGANDGASGVAVLVELGRVLPRLNDTIRFVLFDGEDGGEWPSPECTDWLLGSSANAAAMNDADVKATKAFVLVDMVGDPSLRLPRELSSYSRARALQDRIYAIAGGLGYDDVFLNDTRYGETYQIIDDHAPFLERGISAVDLIHLEPTSIFPAWHHTQHDDMTHVSAASLAKVGRTLELWLLELD